MALPEKLPEYVLIAFACLLIGYGTGAVLTARKNTLTLCDTVAVKWSDGIHETPAYCAHVYLVPYMSNDFRGLAARLQVYIGRDPGKQQFTAEHHLGLVKDQSEGARSWGKLRWEKDGLHLGEGNDTMFFPLTNLRPK